MANQHESEIPQLAESASKFFPPPTLAASATGQLSAGGRYLILAAAVLGWVGDRFGRVRAMGLSIVWYSLFAGVAYFSRTPEQLLVLRFISALGVGGMWPAAVSLASEAWSDVSRPILSGLIGTSANVGIV